MKTPQNTIEQTIVSTRVFNTPIEKVFRAFTEPEHLKAWWGPKGFTNTFHEFDLRLGGTWKFTMHGPDKGNYENEVVFTKIEKPNFISWDRVSKPLFQINVTFEELTNTATKVIFKMIFTESREYETIKKFAPEKNEENFDRLEKVLKEM